MFTAIGTHKEKASFTRDRMLPLANRVMKMRNLGACAYDLANLAAGRVSGFFEYGVNDWDLAAGRILVEAAGGRCSARPLDSGKWLFAASGKNIHADLRAALFD